MNRTSAPEPELSRDEVRDRASAGALIMAAWGVVNLTGAFFGNLALARLLEPRDFGLVAVGMTVMILSGAVADGGLANGLLRRPNAPTPDELRTLTGIAFAITGSISVVIAAVGLQLGTAGQVTALMAASLPISALQGAGRVKLGRAIRMKAISAIDAGSLIGYYVWAITAVLLGAGVWGLATATVFRALCGTIVVSRLPGAGLPVPTLRQWREFGELLWFGLRFQANWLAIVGREQAVNVVTVVVSGVVTLGLYSLATRLLLMASLVADSISRVTVPTMTHTMARGDDPRQAVERISRLAATALTIALPAFVAGTPELVPTLFGSDWERVPEVFPGAALGLLVVGVAATAGVGYLFADNRPGTVLTATLAYGAAMVATASALVPVIELHGLGAAWAVGATAEAVVLFVAVRRRCGANILRPLLVHVPVAVLGTLAGRAVAQAVDYDLAAGALAAAVASAVATAGLALAAWSSLLDLSRITVRAARGAIG